MESDSQDEAAAKLQTTVRAVAADPGEADWMSTRLRSLVGLGGAEDHSVQSESFSAWRSYLEALAETRPLVLVFEDLHWADDGLLDFVDQLADWARGASILVLCTARPELLEDRPGWGGGKLNATTVLLEPLGSADCETLLDQLADELGPETRAQAIGASEGNPLFLQEMLELARWHGQWAGDFGELEEIGGGHLEQAVRYQQELGRASDPELSRDAADRLYAAGLRAGARSDVAAARNLLERALWLAPEGDHLHTRI